MMDYILTTSSLTKKYGDKVAAGNIDIHIRKGEIYGLIGRNGAGKTTIMRVISGLSRPTSGSYQFHDESKRGIGVLIEQPGIFKNRTAFDNLKIKCLAMNCFSADYVNGLLKTVGLDGTGNKKVGSFSLGMRQRLGIALALTGDPSLIVLDEPINGLDPQGIVEIRETLEKLRDEKGVTIMVSSHILDELGKIADSFGIINNGGMVAEFTREELLQRCGKYLTIHTDNNAKAVEVIRSMGVESRIVSDAVRIDDIPGNAAQINKALVDNGLAVDDFHATNLSLEDYYLSLTGGNADD